jgi:7-carboxy-7-deazaguanine synthase
MYLTDKIHESFQGEGKSLRKPVVFLRTAGCNLACIWCDTPYTWNWLKSPFKHPEKYDRTKEVYKMSSEDIAIKLNSFKIRSLVISGGEPMLQQEELIELIIALKGYGWWIEIETNGTIEPSEVFLHLIDQINCSPKLLNSGPDNYKYKRIVPSALKKLALSQKTNFKFVVQSDSDMREILEIIDNYNISPSRVYLMPEGRLKKEQEKIQEKIGNLCRKYGLNFTPRLHILMFGDKRGV